MEEKKDMPQKIFTNIWYLPTEYIWQTWRLSEFRDSGRLVIDDESVQFIGSHGRVDISNIRRVSIGQQGRDIINDWVKVEYGQNDLAYFADGSYVGWGGLLGGTVKLYAALYHFNKNVATAAVQ